MLVWTVAGGTPVDGALVVGTREVANRQLLTAACNAHTLVWCLRLPNDSGCREPTLGPILSQKYDHHTQSSELYPGAAYPIAGHNSDLQCAAILYGEACNIPSGNRWTGLHVHCWQSAAGIRHEQSSSSTACTEVSDDSCFTTANLNPAVG